MRGLDWQPITVPFVAGLDQKSDPRAMRAPNLAVCRDVQFDEVGGLQARYPFTALGSNILGGGTISNARKLVAYGDELLLFTKDTLYTWNAQSSKWVSRGTHLATKIEETPAFVTSGDQCQCDRAELNGVVVYAWADALASGSVATGAIWIAAVDKTTGSVLMAPYDYSSAHLDSGASRPRLVALSTKILMFYVDDSVSTDLMVIDIDPANVASSVAAAPTTVLAATNFNLYYDVVKQPSADTAIVACRRVTTTSYTVGTVTSAKVVTLSTKARTCDGPIAVSCPTGGTTVQVIRANGTNIQGDFLTIGGLIDVTTDQAVGTVATPCNQIAAAHRSVQDSGEYRCYAFWTGAEATDGASSFQCKSNWVDTGGTLGTQANFVSDLGVASRAFDHDGRVYVHLAFGGSSQLGVAGLRGQLQNTYFLYRDDALLIGKEVSARGGGHSSITGHLPNVANTDTGVYHWCAIERRIIPVSSEQLGYAARTPVDVTITFDTNEARRMARLGQTLYITGGEVLQYDGSNLAEVGFHTYPWRATVNTGAAGNVADGVYTYKETWRWDNAKGERDRSTTATTKQVTVAAGPLKVTYGVNPPLRSSHKASMAVEIWRTPVNPALDSPFYLATGQDPSATSGDNCYIVMPSFTSGASIANFSDNYADATLTTKETNPENGDVLESLAPPAASIISATDSRIFLGGIAGDPDRIWYSKQRPDGEVAAFHDALTIGIPKQGGAMSAIAFLNETLVVFRETAIYTAPGDGFDNTAGGQNYGPARAVSVDLGAVNAESVAVTPQGLIFKSSKGWYLLNRGWGLDYIGGQVADFDAYSVIAVHVVESRHQIRCVVSSSGTSALLVFDYLVNQWAEWTVTDAIDACVWNSTYHTLTSTGPKYERTNWNSDTDFGIDVETAWINPYGMNVEFKVRWFEILGSWQGNHDLNIRVAKDFKYTSEGVPLWFDNVFVSPVTTSAPGDVEDVRYPPTQQRCKAIKVRITAVSNGGDHTDPPTAEAMKLTGLSIMTGIEPGIAKRLAIGTAPSST